VKSFFCRTAKLIAISFLISSLLHSAPELASAMPARGLYVPIFDASGVKIWEITGTTGEIRENHSIVVSNMLVSRCENGGGTAFTIESGYANVIPSSKSACGDGVVTMNGDSFTAVAEDWTFRGEEKKFTANRGVRVIFGENVAAGFAAP
jgi:hypothetical protein